MPADGRPMGPDLGGGAETLLTKQLKNELEFKKNYLKKIWSDFIGQGQLIKIQLAKI